MDKIFLIAIDAACHMVYKARMSTPFSKSFPQMTLKILFLTAFTVSSVVGQALASDGKGTLGVADTDKGTLGVLKKRKNKTFRKDVRRSVPAEAEGSAPGSSPGKKKQVESEDKGTIGKSTVNPASTSETPGIERAHAEEVDPETACEFIKLRSKQLIRLAAEIPAKLEIEANKQLEDFDAKKFDQEPLREYLLLIASTLATLEKSQDAGQWNPLLREQQTRLLQIRNQIRNEIVLRAQSALNIKGCR